MPLFIRIPDLVVVLAMFAVWVNCGLGFSGEGKAEGKSPASEKTIETALLQLSFTEGDSPAAGRVLVYDAAPLYYGNLPGLKWFWSENSCRIRLPVGKYNIDFMGGPRKGIYRNVVEVNPGRENHFLVEREEYAPVSSVGWRVFDPVVAVDNKAPKAEDYGYSTLREVCLAARCEGVDVVGLSGAWSLMSPTGKTFLEMQTGQQELGKSFAQEGRDTFSPLYASCGYLPGTGAFYSLEPSAGPHPKLARHVDFFDIFAGIKDRGGVVVINHPTGVIADLDTGESLFAAGELIFDVVAGPGFDALDIGSCREDVELWHLLLNQGYRISALSGGGGSRFPEGLDIPGIGAYLKLPVNTFSAAEALDAIRDGKIIASNGPFVRLVIGGVSAGESISPEAGKREIFIEALSSSKHEDSIESVDLIYNGKVIDTLKAIKNQKVLRSHRGHTLPNIGWLVARYNSADNGMWAYSNPIYISAPEFRVPDPTMASVKLSVVADETGEHLPATIEVFNLGSRIDHRIAEGGEAELKLPATAVLRISAPGMIPRKLSIYRDGGPKKMIDDLRKSKRLRAAMLEWKTYQDMKKLLGKVTFTVRLQRMTGS